jgi:hypothetical protein
MLLRQIKQKAIYTLTDHRYSLLVACHLLTCRDGYITALAYLHYQRIINVGWDNPGTVANWHLVVLYTTHSGSLSNVGIHWPPVIIRLLVDAANRIQVLSVRDMQLSGEA